MSTLDEDTKQAVGGRDDLLDGSGTEGAMRQHMLRHEPVANRPDFRPVVVADRPNHLRIVQEALEETDRELGIMTHANVTETVVDMLAGWPTDLRERTTIIADSGAFQANETPPIRELFRLYDRMGVDYGIIPDVIGDPETTSEIAWDAAATYDSWGADWHLVGVSHGSSADEYERHYQDLRALGYDYVAVGGLLEQRGDRSGGHATAGAYLWDVVRRLREYAPGAWLFALGAGHRRRNPRFRDLEYFGADGKGWLHRYDDTDSREHELVEYLRTGLLTDSRQTGLNGFSTRAGGSQ